VDLLHNLTLGPIVLNGCDRRIVCHPVENEIAAFVSVDIQLPPFPRQFPWIDMDPPWRPVNRPDGGNHFATGHVTN
jgi:hypothetical protein